MVASNTPWDLDASFLRRIEKRIYVPLPVEQNRFEILTEGLKNIQKNKDINLHELAAKTTNYSGSDLKGIIKEIQM